MKNGSKGSRVRGEQTYARTLRVSRHVTYVACVEYDRNYKMSRTKIQGKSGAED